MSVLQSKGVIPSPTAVIGREQRFSLVFDFSVCSVTEGALWAKQGVGKLNGKCQKVHEH